MSTSVHVEVTVNGEPRQADIEPRTLLVHWLRDDLGLLGSADELHPLQRGFWEKHGLQCGFCTPGMIMAAADLLERNPNPTDEEIRHGLEGNLCRCTGYVNIVKAVKAAATA